MLPFKLFLSLLFCISFLIRQRCYCRSCCPLKLIKFVCLFHLRILFIADKLVSLEDGLIPDVKTSYVKRMMGTTNGCKQLIQCIKFLLYFELLLFVGWAFYTIVETYTVESMEHKITDSIRDSESHNSLPQQSPYEETTMTTGDVLTEMENLLQTENALEKTVEEQIKKLHGDETDPNSGKTTEVPRLEVDEKGVEVEDLPLLKTHVPKLVNVEIEEDLGTTDSEDTNPDSSKSEDTNFDSSKSEETVLVWNFGFLPFPNTYNIKVQPQSSPSDSEKSRSREIAEKFFGMDSHSATNDDTDEITSALTEHMLLSLILEKALRDAEMMSTSEDDTEPKLQDSMFDEQLRDTKEDYTPLMMSSLTDFGSEDWKDDSVYGDIIDRSVRENTNDKTPGDFNEQNQDFAPEIGSDFIDPTTNSDDMPDAIKRYLNQKQDEAERDRMIEPDMSSWVPSSEGAFGIPISIGQSIPWAEYEFLITSKSNNKCCFNA